MNEAPKKKPRPTVVERAAKYLSAMESPRRAKSDPQDSHLVVLNAAVALVRGFKLPRDKAEVLLREYLGRSDKPWTEPEIRHKMDAAEGYADNREPGYLLGNGLSTQGDVSQKADAVKRFPVTQKASYDVEALKRFAGGWAEIVDLIWLANHSVIDPATLDAAGYLRSLYAPGEHVVIFDNEYSQGCAVWPADEAKIPKAAKCGVWYLAQPVDGQYHPNPRSTDKDGNAKMSRRSEESVTSWRYLVIESDDAPLKLWLGALVQLPLRIAAIYTSGSRSVHALVRVDAQTKAHWDAIKAECFGAEAPAGRFLIRNGADKGVLSAVRLTRLPGCLRQGKFVEDGDGKSRYVRWDKPAPQKLLYINPNPDAVPLTDKLARRDVVSYWLWLAKCGISDADDTGGKWLKQGLAFYATRNQALAEALKEVERL